jgi:hypothetical protein
MGLIREFQQADAQRRKEVAALAREVAARRGDFRKFVGHLHKVSGDRRSEVATMQADINAFVGHLHKLSGDRRSEVGAMRGDADAFVSHLHQVSADRRSDVAALGREVAIRLGDFRKADAQRRREVAAMKAEVAAMRADADAFVGHLHNKVGADRRADVAAVRTLVWGGAAPVGRAAPRPRAATPPPPAKETAPAARREAKAQTIALRDVVFEYLADHPDGVRLTDMEREFGVARIQIAKALRGLLDDNKVEKRELVYFAI